MIGRSEPSEGPTYDKRWLEFRNKLDDVMTNGVLVSSVGRNWYSPDRGNGVATMGVNTCVAVATPDMLGHIPADRYPNNADVRLFLDIIIHEKEQIHVFGLRDGRLMKAVLEIFQSAGVKPIIHFNDDRNTAFNIVVQNRRIDFYQE